MTIHYQCLKSNTSLGRKIHKLNSCVIKVISDDWCGETLACCAVDVINGAFIAKIFGFLTFQNSLNRTNKLFPNRAWFPYSQFMEIVALLSWRCNYSQQTPEIIKTDGGYLKHMTNILDLIENQKITRIQDSLTLIIDKLNNLESQLDIQEEGIQQYLEKNIASLDSVDLLLAGLKSTRTAFELMREEIDELHAVIMVTLFRENN